MILKKLFESTKQELSVDQAWELITTDAQPFLKAVGYNVPLRGTSGPDIFIGQYRTDRVSSAGANLFQTQVDEWLKEHGAKALRSNSIFLANTPDVTYDYGAATYMIFPLGDFHYHWYKYAPDLIGVINVQDFNKIDPDLLDKKTNNTMTAVNVQIDQNIEQWATTTHHELVINSDKGYLAINAELFMNQFYIDFDNKYQLPPQMERKYGWLK